MTGMTRKHRIAELLAPAGSVEGMKAAFQAGADAVYIGGRKFGARAYADNPEDTQLLEAIDYAHLRDRHLYLTLNTLLKPEELSKELYSYIQPLYRQGLDAVLVQDLGVFLWLKKYFPDLPVHISTQMGITGAAGARLLQQAGAKRIVLARELGLSEIKEINRQLPDLELECFVHGALCYCYSGQCLFSSLAGGRSGNRGRCAQPCRMQYQVQDGEHRQVSGQKDGYVLSPKELCTLSLLPDLLEAGVASLKIEGRMKKTEYAAGVVSIYRKYLDLYQELGKKAYQVESEDMQRLLDLFQRVGFTDGYYYRHNGKEMMTLEKPIFRKENVPWISEIREQYIDKESYQKINGKVTILQHLPVTIEVWTKISGQTFRVTVKGEPAVTAQKQPLTEESVLRQLKKTGTSAFVWDQLELELDEQVFIAVGRLNALRREALEQLEQKILRYVRRESSVEDDKAESVSEKNMAPKADSVVLETAPVEVSGKLAVLVSTWEQLQTVLKQDMVSRIYLESFLLAEQEAVIVLKQCKESGKEVYLASPHMMREDLKADWEDILLKCETVEVATGKKLLDGYLIRNLEGLAQLLQRGSVYSREFAADFSMYTFQPLARQQLADFGVTQDTVPLELNQKEIRQRGMKNSTMVIYGYAPMMQTANCICSSTSGCQKKKGKDRIWYLKDRENRVYAVRRVCAYCYNIIYNCVPLSLHEYAAELQKEAAWLRMDFTLETPEAVERILAFYRQYIQTDRTDLSDLSRDKRKPAEEFRFTRGHFGRGVE